MYKIWGAWKVGSLSADKERCIGLWGGWTVGTLGEVIVFDLKFPMIIIHMIPRKKLSDSILPMQCLEIHHVFVLVMTETGCFANLVEFALDVGGA